MLRAEYLKSARRTRFRLGLSCPREWRPELEALATELDFPLAAASAIEQRFLEVIEMLAQSANADA